MSEQAAALKAEIKKLSAAAIALKMDLHDLAEDLPIGWQTVTAVAGRVEDAYRALEDARARLKTLETTPRCIDASECVNAPSPSGV